MSKKAWQHWNGIGVTLLCMTASLSHATWTVNLDVESITSADGHHVLTTNFSGNLCGTSGNFHWPTTDPDAQDMFALALTAFASDKKIRVLYDQNSSGCAWGTSKLITQLQIRSD